MRPAIKPEIDRIITGAEVRGWFARGRKPPPSEDACFEIATRLTKTRWKSDSPMPAIPDNMWWVRAYPCPVWFPEPYVADPWWNPEEAAAAAKALLEDVPAMLWHWHRMQTAPETLPGQKPARLRGGYDAIERLRIALDAALPYIEFPVGEYERQDRRKAKRPKDWHLPAIVAAHFIGKALCSESTARDSVRVRVVTTALGRMGYSVENDTIHQYLKGRAIEQKLMGEKAKRAVEQAVAECKKVNKVKRV
jgi:hypothetical protein